MLLHPPASSSLATRARRQSVRAIWWADSDVVNLLNSVITLVQHGRIRSPIGRQTSPMRSVIFSFASNVRALFRLLLRQTARARSRVYAIVSMDGVLRWC